MNRELLSKAVGDIDDRFVAEARFSVPGDTTGSPERIVHMKKKRIITFALAAALVIALSVGAYAAGLFGKVEITKRPVDPDDPFWADLLEAFPDTGEVLYAEWEANDNHPTAEMEAMLAEMGTEDYFGRYFASVREIEETYGIELLKVDGELGWAYAYLSYTDKNDHSAGSFVSGMWTIYGEDIVSKKDYDEYVSITTSFVYACGGPEFSAYACDPLGEDETTDVSEYEIRSLGVTAQIVSGQDMNSDPEISAFFSYGGIDYLISTDLPIDSLCALLETLHK